MLIILMLIESRSKLIVDWLGDRKLINTYFTRTAYKILTSKRNFKDMFLFFVYLYFVLNSFVLKKQISIETCKLGTVLNSNEVCPWMLMRKGLLAILMLMQLRIRWTITPLWAYVTKWRYKDLVILLLSVGYISKWMSGFVKNESWVQIIRRRLLKVTELYV